MKSDGTEIVWKALADPTRRRILDLLRQGPKTTGELCQPFRVSRFAVMKHLAILERAHLVLVRRAGRERWNHLNPVPIRQIYERWVSPFASMWAQSAVRLQKSVETKNMEPTMAKESKVKNEFGVAQVELEIPIKATPKQVWETMIEDTNEWWSKDFLTSQSAKAFVIEPKLGGHAYEDWGKGAGQIWYTVVGVDPAKFIMMSGFLTAQYGGPANTLLHLTLKPDGKQTILQLSDTIYGRVGDDKLSQTEEGWRFLFEEGLKKCVEGKLKN